MEPERSGTRARRGRRLSARRSTKPRARKRSKPQAERLVSLRRSHGGDREVTVYVKGFLARGEKPDHFEGWMASHDTLVLSHEWGPRAHGFAWASGRLERPPIPFASAAKMSFDLYRRLRGGPAKLVGGLGLAVAEQVARMAIRLAVQYRDASQAAAERAEHLERRLALLAERYERVRVVAHSLGCLHVVHAVSRLAPELRPHEIHLCGPACREAELGPRLAGLARDSTWLYHTRKDLVLEVAFRLMARGRALGAVGPEAPYPGLASRDVSGHFGFRVHAHYARRLPHFASPHPAERMLGGTEPSG